jgi:hypothetical protein
VEASPSKIADLEHNMTNISSKQQQDIKPL